MEAHSELAARLARDLARQFRRRMLEEYTPRIERCVRLLTEPQVWQRPGPTGNAIGNLLLHLEGNVRQWILGGIAGHADRRDRTAEFAAGPTTRASAAELLRRLRATVEEACIVVDRLTAPELLATRRFQDRYDETVLAAVVHVLEHFSGHAAQIYAFTKQLTATDLRHYDL